jgi:hypothetical protein
MTEKKQEVQVETPVEGEQPEPTEWTPPTKEEYEAKLQELDKAKNQANTFQGLLKDSQKKSITRDDLGTIYDRIDSQQRWIATAFDDFRKGFGDSLEPGQRNYLEDAEKNITEAQKARQVPRDPEADKFFDYLAEESLEFEEVEGNFVYDNIKETKTPKDALRAVKAAVKERDKVKLRDDLKSEIESERQKIREDIIKEYGLSDSPPGPSAAKKDLSSMTPDEKLQEGFKKYQKK